MICILCFQRSKFWTMDCFTMIFYYVMIWIVTRKLRWQEFLNSIKKASKKHQNYKNTILMLWIWLKKWLIYAVYDFQQSLQNRVPRVRVLLPLPLKALQKGDTQAVFEVFLLFIKNFKICYVRIDFYSLVIEYYWIYSIFWAFRSVKK